MLWVAITIYILLIISSFILEKLVKRKFNLAKDIKYNKRFSKNQTLIENLMLIIFFIGLFMSNITVFEKNIYRPLNPIPTYLWLSLYLFVLFGFRGYVAKRVDTDSRVYYIHFVFSVWFPIIIIIAYRATKILL
ncbi:DUF4181 domain-containing protein [Lysinibacillus sp. NPDC093197]|uniref:DUF4181 domain-containing protein n=1 Tax=Lysinibacillus sp. NPDC093197 TaxID=3364132 RepID=UPI0038202185